MAKPVPHATALQFCMQAASAMGKPQEVLIVWRSLTDLLVHCRICKGTGTNNSFLYSSCFAMEERQKSSVKKPDCHVKDSD